MANFLTNFLDLFKKNSNSVLGIDIGLSSVKVVQLRRSAGQAVLETYGELALGPYAGVEVGRATHLSPSKISEAVLDVIRESRATTMRSGVALPVSASLVSVIEMPRLEEKQLAQMIPIEARKYIPVPITEVTLDWFVIPKEEQREIKPAASMAENPSTGGDKMNILIVAIHNEAVARYRELLKQTGLQSSFFEVEVFSTMRAVLGQDLKPVMIIDMGASSTKLYIIDEGIVRMSHAVNQGSQNITIAISRALGVSIDQAEGMKRNLGLSLKKDGKDMAQVMTGMLSFILSEANRVLGNYEKHSARIISRVILSGGGVNLPGFKEMAGVSLQAPVELASPFSEVQAPAFIDPVLKAAGPEFSVAVGVALRRLQEIN